MKETKKYTDLKQELIDEPTKENYIQVLEYIKTSDNLWDGLIRYLEVMTMLGNDFTEFGPYEDYKAILDYGLYTYEEVSDKVELARNNQSHGYYVFVQEHKRWVTVNAYYMMEMVTEMIEYIDQTLQ